MDTDGVRFAEIVETTSFLHYFSELPDHRQPGKVNYPLPEVLLLILLAVLAGAEAFTDIARFGERKIELLRRLFTEPSTLPFSPASLRIDPRFGRYASNAQVQALLTEFIAARRVPVGKDEVKS